MTNWRLLAGVVLAVGLIGVLIVCLLYGLTGGDIPFDHGIIIDAGSSHSQVTLYRWQGDKYNGTGCVTQLDTCGVEDGLSSFNIPEKAGDSLLPCLKTVSERIPKEKRSTSPVYLGATAGMRLVNISDPYLNLATFTAVRCMLPKSGLEVRDVGIISGGSEGLYAWITTNFLLGIVQKRMHPTVGALDMGGASTQISFEVNPVYKGKENVFSMRLYGEDYHVYSVSYLCYGIFETYRRYLTIIADDPERTSTIPHPCAPNGLKLVHDANFLFNQPCTTTETYMTWVTLNPKRLNQTYTFEGTGNVNECKKVMVQVYDFNDCSKKFKECFKKVDKIMMPETFMAFSAYYYTMVYFNASDSGKTSLDTFQTTLDKFCSLSWDDAQKLLSPAADPRLIYRYCFQGQAISHLLTAGYGYNDTTWSNVKFTKKVNGTDVGWSLGYMIQATNALPAELPTPPIISVALFVIILLICAILIILFFVFFKRHKSYKKSSMPNV